MVTVEATGCMGDMMSMLQQVILQGKEETYMCKGDGRRTEPGSAPGLHKVQYSTDSGVCICTCTQTILLYLACTCTVPVLVLRVQYKGTRYDISVIKSLGVKDNLTPVLSG